MAIENYEKLRNAMLSSLIESRYAEEVARLLELRSIEDAQAQPDLVRLITERALSDDPIEFTEYPHARADLSARALYLNGFNPQGEDFGLDISEPEFKQLIDTSVGSEGFVDDGTVKLLLKYQNDKDAYRINEKLKSYLDTYLEANLARVVEVAEKNNIEHEPVVDTPVNAMPNNSTLPEVDASPDMVIPADELVSENSMDQSVAVVERGDLDYEAKYRRDADREVEARKRISQIIDSARLGNPENNQPSIIFVERRVIDKLKSFVENKLADALDPVPLDYPSESLFSSSLSEMDDNGRVTKVHLHYRKDKVVMPSANSPKEVYDIMAAKVLEKGIKNPYLKANFRNPRDAEKFIRESISSLTALGYDIEEMRVHPKHKVLFENIKAEYLDVINAIEEAPQELVNDIAPDEPTLEEINAPITVITAERIKPENPVPVEQLSSDQLNNILLRSGYLEPQGVDKYGEELKLTERNADTVNVGKAYVEKLIGKIASERGLGSREAEKLGALDSKLVEFAFGDKPELLSAYEGFKANSLQNVAPQNNDHQNSEFQNNEPQYDESNQNDGRYPDHGDPNNGFAPDNSEPSSEPPPAYPLDSMMDEQMYDTAEGQHDYNPVADHYDSSPNGGMENQGGASNDAPPNNSMPEMTSADKYMMSMAQGAKKTGGDFGYMSSKQLKGVAVLNAKANLPVGSEGRVSISDASKSTLQKVKDSVASDIKKMVSGERVSKERYKALASQSDKAIVELAGEDGLEALKNIKEKSKKYQNDKLASAPQQDVPQQDVPQQDVPQQDVPQQDVPQQDVPQQDVPQQDAEGLNVEGFKGQAMDDFELPSSNVEQSQEYDIPKAERQEEPAVNLREMKQEDIAKLQASDPAVVKIAVEYEMSKIDVLPDAQNKFIENLPEAVKVSYAETLGLQPQEQKVEPQSEIGTPENKEDDPDLKRKSPKPKIGR
tara:strand:- start:1893 stop:4739 length:2847 start_codon:yes stop_codon:yes gene_type:complete